MSRSVSPGAAMAFVPARRGGFSAWEMNTADDLKRRGRSVQNIAAFLGRPMEDVARMFAAPPVEAVAKVEPTCGRPVSFWTPARLRDLRLLYVEANLSAEATADILGCTPTSVASKTSKLGMTKGGMKPVRGPLIDALSVIPALKPIADEMSGDA